MSFLRVLLPAVQSILRGAPVLLCVVSWGQGLLSAAGPPPPKSVVIDASATMAHPNAASGYRQYGYSQRGPLVPRLDPRSYDAASNEIPLPMHVGTGAPVVDRPPLEPFWVPLLHWKHRLFRHTDPNDPLRHMGWGGPLQGTSWRNRPLYAGWLFGNVSSDPLTDAVSQGDDLMGGYRFGWDFDHYWGTELRFAWANVGLAGVPATEPQTAGHLYYDINLLYYPWGDSRWRPYAGLGLGAARFRFHDDLTHEHDATLVGLPLQLGVKYQYRKWLALRLDLTDNLAIGADGLETMNNVSLSGGVEVHFGGWRRSYFPWSPTTGPW